MCDLWKSTNSGLTPIGAIPAQIDVALATLHCPSAGADGLPQPPPPTQIKLYNSGSFFDPTSIPPSDYSAIAARVVQFSRVVVECHPALVGEGTLSFLSHLKTAAAEEGCPVPQLEVAMGLESAHPDVLRKLNKGMTLDQFRHATGFLTSHQVDVRAFLLLRPPFLDEEEGVAWACKSLDFAFDAGVRVATVIPTRPGNPDMEPLAQSGEFTPPLLSSLEKVIEFGLTFRRGLVLADLWDLERCSTCQACFQFRRNRLETMNLTQQILPHCLCPRNCRG